MRTSAMFYYLHFNDDDDGVVAYASRPDVTSVEQCAALPGDPLSFSLQDNMAEDYQVKNLAWPLMSRRLRQLLDAENGGMPVTWQSVPVASERRIIPYFVPIFTHTHDVLDWNHTKVLNGAIGVIVVKDCLAWEKVDGLAFFSLQNKDSRLVVSDRVKARIDLHKLTGMYFSPVPVQRAS